MLSEKAQLIIKLEEKNSQYALATKY